MASGRGRDWPSSQAHSGTVELSLSPPGNCINPVNRRYCSSGSMRCHSVTSNGVNKALANWRACSGGVPRHIAASRSSACTVPPTWMTMRSAPVISSSFSCRVRQGWSNELAWRHASHHLLRLALLCTRCTNRAQPATGSANHRPKPSGLARPKDCKASKCLRSSGGLNGVPPALRWVRSKSTRRCRLAGAWLMHSASNARPWSWERVCGIARTGRGRNGGVVGRLVGRVVGRLVGLGQRLLPPPAWGRRV